MRTSPSCCCESPQCLGCCEEAAELEDAYTVDLGAGGLIDDECDFCDQIAGEYVVSYSGSCSWLFSEDSGCGPCGQCSGGCGGDREFFVSLELLTDGENCVWRVTASLSAPADDTCNGCGTCSSITVYESAAITDTECEDLPVTLNKVSEDWTDYCTGSLPSSITLDV